MNGKRGGVEDKRGKREGRMIRRMLWHGLGRDKGGDNIPYCPENENADGRWYYYSIVTHCEGA